MIELVIWALSLFYTIYFVFLLVGWMKIRIPEERKGEELTHFSIIIPVRNEQAHIYRLLKDLDEQNYPKEKFEIIVADDSSEDGTAEEVERAVVNLSVRILLIKSSDEKPFQGKKEALTCAIASAGFNHIIATDGDCRIGENWLRQYSLMYESSDARMVLGPVAYHEEEKFFGKLQKVEFSALIGLGAASLEIGIPNICNGANLSYEKSLFDELEGYKGNKNVPSGDDEFLLQKAFSTFPDKIRFLKSFEALCYTDAKENIPEFIDQRIRWSAKWKYHRSLRMKLWGLAMFLFNLSFALFTILLFYTGRTELFLSTFMVKLIIEYVYIYKVNSDLRDENPFVVVIFLQLVYPFYTIFLMMSSLLKRYRWKGRLYL